MTNSRFAKRRGLSVIVGLGVIVGMTACDPGDESADEDEAVAALAGGTAAGGVGVVQLALWTGVNGTPAVFCTGTVIANNRIITAAHCLDEWMTIRANGHVTYLLEGDGILASVNYTDDGTNWTCLTHPTDGVCRGTVDGFASMHVSRMSGDGNLPDIAVLRFASPFQRIRASRFRELSTQELRLKRSVEVWGAGVTSAAGPTVVVMKRAVVRITELNATSFKTDTSSAQTCDGDSGGPLFAGASNLIVGIHRSSSPGSGKCGVVGSTTVNHRITPTVINFINKHREGADPACRETIAGTGFYRCY